MPVVVCDEQTAAGLFFLLAATIPFYRFTKIRVSLKDVCKGLKLVGIHFCKIDFEEFVDDDDELKMSGCMKGVNLKRMDASCTREIFCYDLFHRYGIWTAPRASHTRVLIKFIEDIDNPEATEPTTTVNFGVYEMFEDVNKQLLKARSQGEIEAQNAWKNNKGNLWKCSNDLTLGRSGEMGVEDIRIIRAGETQPSDMKKNGREDDYRVGYVWKNYSLDLKTNKDNFNSASSEFLNFINELNALPVASDENDTSSINTIKAFYEKWFDVDFFLKTYAVNILCGMDDDYWGNANNYYLYFDTGSKGSGKVYFIPFDYDNTLDVLLKKGALNMIHLTGVVVQTAHSWTDCLWYRSTKKSLQNC